MYLGLMPPMYISKDGEIVVKHKTTEKTLVKPRNLKREKIKLLTIHDVMKLDDKTLFAYTDKDLEKFTGLIITESKVTDSVYDHRSLMNQLTLIGTFMSPREVVN